MHFDAGGWRQWVLELVEQTIRKQRAGSAALWHS